MIKYYLITVLYIPWLCEKEKKYSMVISEHPSEFLLKQLENGTKRDNISILYSIEIAPQQYTNLFKYNPTNEHYFKMLTRDYSMILTEEGGEEEEK